MDDFKADMLIEEVKNLTKAVNNLSSQISFSLDDSYKSVYQNMLIETLDKIAENIKHSNK